MQLRSVCPYDCPDTCGLLVTVKDNKALKVEGDPAHPVTRGFLCSKMQNYQRTVHSEQRLTVPLLRHGAKGSGQFTPISWSEAIERICSRWRDIIASHSAEAILPYSYAGTMGLVQRNSGHPFFHKLGASRLARTICMPAKEFGWKALMGDTPALDPNERLDSDLYILWGMNAAATSIHSMAAAREIQKRGGRVWAIDTYLTPTCDAADRAIVIRPGSDGALALGMLNVIVSEKLTDNPFIDKHLSGYAEFVEQVLPDCSPEEMSKVCGLLPETIRELARVYASAVSPFIQTGGGLTRYGNGAMNIRCITCLPAFVGAWQRKGAGLFGTTSTGAAFPVALVTREDFMQKPSRIISMNQLGTALNQLSDPPVMGLYVYHSNPASIAPDQNAVMRGLARKDLFTVVHERFMTDTAMYADIVLPATSSLEHPDLYRCYGSYHAQRCNAVIPPVGESKSNWEVFSMLAAGMGWDEPFFKQSADQLVELLLEGENLWRDETTTLKLRSGEPVYLSPPSSPRGPWLTSTGRIELLNLSEPEPLPRLLPTHAEQDQLPLRLMPAVTPHALNSSFYEQPELRLKQSCMELLMNALDAAQRDLADGDRVVAFNCYGEVEFALKVSERVPVGTVVTEGVWWQSLVEGRGVNALTSQRLTDRGEGSTLYDVAVDVRRAD